jgi:hypothetical protein
MLVGVILAVTPTRGVGRVDAGRTPRPAPQRSSSSFMDRMNDRWDRRQGGDH